jgi:T4 RnlA family RNA ligase
MNFYLPTYDECLTLTKMDNSPFYESINYVDEYKVSVFNYRLATIADFKLKGALEIRGICFVFNIDNTLFKRYLLMHKFFNINQTEDTLYDVVKNYKVKNVFNKEDGSLATFIKLPNGKVVGKTKMGFDNDQAIAINEIYSTNSDIKRVVDYLLDNNLIPMFEYVAPDNKIVLNYFDRKLILIKVRNNNTGNYVELSNLEVSLDGVDVVVKESYILDELVNLTKTLEDKEGWVVEFDNGLHIKIKTDFYFRLHMLLTDDIQKENKLIEFVLDEKIDDILSQIPLNDIFTRNKIENISEIVLREVNHLASRINDSYDEYLKLNISQRDYAISYRIKNNLFPYVMLRIKNNKLKGLTENEILSIYSSYKKYEDALNNTESFNIAKDVIRKRTLRLMEAREWLSEVSK